MGVMCFVLRVMLLFARGHYHQCSLMIRGDIFFG
jgi:hypothetical protein